jgi:hypothetical protein
MNVLRKLWSALGSLAGNVAAPAETVREINGTLRRRAGIDGNDPLAPALPGAQLPAGMAVATPTASRDATENAGAGKGPPVPWNGRMKAAAAE